MSFINDVGNFIGSGKLETVVSDVNKLASTLGIKKPASTQTQQVNASLDQFNTGYLTGTIQRYLPFLVIAGLVFGAFMLARRK